MKGFIFKQVLLYEDNFLKLLARIFETSYKSKMSGIQCCAELSKIHWIKKVLSLDMNYYYFFPVGVRFASSTSHSFSPQSSINEEFKLKKKKKATRINRPHRLLIQLSRALDFSNSLFHSEDDQFWVTTFKGHGVFEGAQQDDKLSCLSSCVLWKCSRGLFCRNL